MIFPSFFHRWRSPAFAWLAAAFLLTVLMAPSAARAQKLQPIPAPSMHVTDNTNTFDARQKGVLEARLVNFEQATGSQVAILMVQTTAPEDIAAYANRVGNTWKIGRRAIGDGLVIIVAKRDRKVRIEVAKALEGAVPDLAAKEVIDEAITPAFRIGDYVGGLTNALDRLEQRIRAEALPSPNPPAPDAAQGSIDGDEPLADRGKTGFQWYDLAVFLFVAVPVLGGVARRVLGRRLGAVLAAVVVGGLAFLFTWSVVAAGVAGVLAWVLAMLSWSGLAPRLGSRGAAGGVIAGTGFGELTRSPFGGSSRSSGGGFRSGGGGDFGGGGASGDW
ncbi:TPM domain-containing protein [Xylophilus sp. GOD-11R]|uniref:TPM domain-containing protein n=1 Tax=Xylophilus sp. GOD-11R TaxID=3089814 RepID=UPI00298BFF10|nr:TPM domain-containing protein [Xylophilus sp. GOD-11R]WPB56750.1 TPM domain-containing protein [Xylophilus sp. GOD-11R]